MPELTPANLQQVEAIYRESHAVWGAGLTLEAYRELWEEIRRTSWATRHASFYVWIDRRDRVLSSVKLYRPLVRLHGSTGRALVLGAVFTAPELRGQGHATEMVQAVLDQARGDGAVIAMLFSDIGSGFYHRLGFRPLPAEEHTAALRRAAVWDTVDWTTRPATASDAREIHEAHRAFGDGRTFAVVRDEEHWEFLEARTAGFFSRLRDPEIRQRSTVVLHGGRFAGYLTTVEGHGEWNVREVGARDGAPGTIADVLRVGAADAFRAGMRRFHGWLPHEVVAHLVDWRVRRHPRARALPMVSPLAGDPDLSALLSPGAAYVPYLDQF